MAVLAAGPVEGLPAQPCCLSSLGPTGEFETALAEWLGIAGDVQQQAAFPGDAGAAKIQPEAGPTGRSSAASKVRERPATADISEEAEDSPGRVFAAPVAVIVPAPLPEPPKAPLELSEPAALERIGETHCTEEAAGGNGSRPAEPAPPAAVPTAEPVDSGSGFEAPVRPLEPGMAKPEPAAAIAIKPPAVEAGRGYESPERAELAFAARLSPAPPSYEPEAALEPVAEPEKAPVAKGTTDPSPVAEQPPGPKRTSPEGRRPAVAGAGDVTREAAVERPPQAARSEPARPLTAAREPAAPARGTDEGTRRDHEHSQPAARPAADAPQPVRAAPPAAVQPAPAPATALRQVTFERPAAARDAVLAATEPTATPEAPARQAAEVREISVRVGERGSGGVDVRLVDRGGEVRVAVRTPDAGLTRSLREGLDELVARVENLGYAAETWTPAGRPVEAQTTGRQPSDASGSPHSGSGSGDGNPDRQGDAGDQQRRQAPEWLEELERLFGRTGQSEKETEAWKQVLFR